MRIRWFESNKSGSYWVLAALWREPQKDRPNAEVASFQSLPGLMLHFRAGGRRAVPTMGGKRGDPDCFSRNRADAREDYDGVSVSQKN